MGDEESSLILGIETSCDETAAAVVAEGRQIRSNVVASQIDLHRQYGGVVPEVASRQHLLAIIPVVEQALGEARVSLGDLAGVAVTYGPGLAGSLLVGVNMAKALALAHGLPLIGINHLEGHIYTNWLLDVPLEFPLLCLIVSGGHSDLVLMSGHGEYHLLGRTIDDAAGEAFDKAARLLGLGYPGGPAVQEAAQAGNPAVFALPRAWLRGTYDFSFSGLKTAVLHAVQRQQSPGESIQTPGVRPSNLSLGTGVVTSADLAAAFQAAVVDVLVEKAKAAAVEHGVTRVLLAGGVAANALLRQEMAARLPVPVSSPPPALCTDNATGVAAAGYFRWQRGERSGWDLDVKPSLRLV
jgi:N6-L-threonylcarbamoyladenine synthase